SHFLLLREDFLAVLIPAVVELALVLVGPLLRHMLRRVHRAGAEVKEERLVGRELLGISDELHGLVRQVLGQMVALFRSLRRFDLMVVVYKVWIILARVAAEEAVIAFEAAPQRPAVVGPGGAGLFGGRQVPLADGIGVVTALQEHLRQKAVLEWN